MPAAVGATVAPDVRVQRNAGRWWQQHHRDYVVHGPARADAAAAAVAAGRPVAALAAARACAAWRLLATAADGPAVAAAAICPAAAA